MKRVHENGIRIWILGRSDDLDSSLNDLLNSATSLTSDIVAMALLIAFNYGFQDEIMRAARCIVDKVVAGILHLDNIDKVCFAAHLDTAGLPDPDVLVQTSGGQIFFAMAMRLYGVDFCRYALARF